MTDGISRKGSELLLRYEKSLDCIHCGLCLSKCPTYGQTGNEAASPRGRVYLMRGLAEGRLDLTDGFRSQMELCLMCRACETVCPSAVEFGRMMEITRHEMHTKQMGSWPGRIASRLFLRGVIPRPRALRAVALLARLYDRSGLRWLVRKTRATRLLPATLRAMEESLPEIPAAAGPLPILTPPEPGAPRRGRVGVLEGCVMPLLFGDVNAKTVAALAHHGYEVAVPAAQTCCGALHAHAGDMETACSLARRNIAAFEAAGVDRIVLNSAGCGAAMRDYAHWLSDAGDIANRAAELSGKVVDVLALAEEDGLEPRGLAVIAGARVTYDAPCHLHHAQRCQAAPLALLKRVPGLDLVPLPGADDCCGAAGIYNLTHPDMSRAVLARKLDQLEATGASVLLTGNPGCILQWRKGIAERGLAIRVLHPVELL